MRYMANAMEVKVTKIDERNWEVTGHSPEIKRFDIGTLELAPYESDEPNTQWVVAFEPSVAEATDADDTETWLAARPFTAKELRELADLMDAIGAAAKAEGLDIVPEQGLERLAAATAGK